MRYRYTRESSVVQIIISETYVKLEVLNGTWDDIPELDKDVYENLLGTLLNFISRVKYDRKNNRFERPSTLMLYMGLSIYEIDIDMATYEGGLSRNNVMSNSIIKRIYNKFKP